MDANKLDEAEVKARVLFHLATERIIQPGAIVASEFRVRSNRIDLAILDDLFVGIEIKTQFDTLRRLREQCSTYSRYFDHLILVVAEKHLDSALDLAPSNVSVWSICKKGSISHKRPTEFSERPDQTNLVDLLTMEEIRAALGRDVPYRNRSEATSNISEPRALFSSAFVRRYSDSSQEFWKSTKHEAIQKKHLVKLSRFANQRKAALGLKKKKQKFWEHWNAAVSQYFNNPQGDNSALY